MDTMTHGMRMFFALMVSDLSKVGVTVIDSGVNINFRMCLYFKLGGGRNPNHLLAFLDAVLRHGGTFHGDIGRNLGHDTGEFCLLVSAPESTSLPGPVSHTEMRQLLVELGKKSKWRWSIDQEKPGLLTVTFKLIPL